MNRTFLILIMPLFLSSFVLKAQDKDVVDNISIALNTGSAKELTNFFNDVVELKIDGEKENYSKKQAEVILRNFFSKYPPVQFNKIHNGSSPEGLMYVLGKYSHKGGSHRVYMLIKQLKGGYKIDTFDLTKE